MRIQHNIMAMNAYRNYNTNTSALSKNLEKLSSGYKINRAGDDAAGLAISEKMRAQITGLNAAQKNVKDGISLVKTAEGAMQEIQDMLNRMDYLATQSANGTYDNEVDRANLQKEVDALKSEINRIADSANFNGIKLMDGSRAESAGSQVSLTASVSSASTAGAPGGGQAIDVSTTANFTGNTTNGGLHEGSAVGSQTTVAFTIDLAGLTATAPTGTENITLSLGTQVLATFTATATTATGFTAGQIATQLQDAISSGVTIAGIKFSVAVSSNDKLTFTLATGATYSASAAEDMNKLLGSKVSIGGSMTSNTAGVEHGLVDITEAVAAENGGLAGIDFTITENLMGQGKQLTIGDTTFVFKTEAGTTPDTSAITATTPVLIDVSGKKTAAEQVKEAVRLIATNGRSIVHDSDGNGTNVTFNISSTGPDKIHLDQQPIASAPKQPIYDEDAMKAMFSAKNPDSAAVQGKLELTPTISAGATVGDRFSFGDGKTYVIAEAGDKNLTTNIAAAQASTATNEITLTAASFDEVISKYAMDKAVKDALANPDTTTYDGSKFTVTVANGKTTISTKNSTDYGSADQATALNAIKTAVEANLASIKINKLTNSDTGSAGLKLQIGDTSDSYNQLQVKIGDMHTTAMGTMESIVEGGKQTAVSGKAIADINISTPEGAHDAINVIKNAINYVSGIRGDLGATQNRLEHTANNLSVMAENIQDAESTIRDTDVAEEMMAYTKNNILIQSAQAMLAQANAVPQGVLQLLG